MKQEVEIITLIYKSVDYLEFIYKQLQSDFNKVDGWHVVTRIVANDATDEVIKRLKELDINYTIYEDGDTHEHYLNSVYRCWNFAAKSSAYENICFVNSDMAFSSGWLDALLKHNLDEIIPCSRLVESGKLLSGTHALVKDFGRHPKEFREKEWLEFAEKNKKECWILGGLYMPCVFNRLKFLETGGYPEGNIYEYGGIGTAIGNVIKSGDAYFFEDRMRLKHITVFNSLVCHFQEGEMDE